MTKLYGPLATGFVKDDHLHVDFHNAEGAVLSDLLNEVLGAEHDLGAAVFTFASDERLMTNLDGCIMFYDKKRTAPITYFCNTAIQGFWVCLAVVGGKAVCFHSVEQLEMLSDWLVNRQETWYEDFHSSSEDTKDEGSGQEKPKPN